ncbi:hypothetical protein [Herbiconiux sp. YIM B11900]|uniref:hypothetical protein n=1 Tax=Herbiconiux sp. YIM B11900 TaxID=3404131 RepID=UPI003F86ADA3
MDEVQVAEFLTVVSMIDNRIVEPETVTAWHRVIGHLDYDTALAAMEMHFGESTVYLLPAHIAGNARRVREQRHPASLPPQREYEAHPRPDNYEAMAAAAGDPVRFAAEVAIYNDQLRAAGFPEVHLNERRR